MEACTSCGMMSQAGIGKLRHTAAMPDLNVNVMGRSDRGFMDALRQRTVAPSERRMIERRRCRNAATPRSCKKTRGYYRAIQGSFKAQFRGADPVDDTLMVAER
jgi:hypothetical protein